MARRKRKVGKFQRCMSKKLKGKKVTKAMFRKAVKACAGKKARKKRARRRRR